MNNRVLNVIQILLVAALPQASVALAATTAEADLTAQLNALPQLDANAARLTETDLRYNTEDPARVPRVTSSEGFDPFASEQRLMAARLPVNGVPVTTLSLSTLVQKSPLAACSQLCSISLPLEGEIPSNLVQFSCDGDRIVRLREYPDQEQGTAFSLAREQVNVTVDGRPGWLQRITRNDGTAETILAWRGRAQGYSLVLPGTDDATARQALAYAESLR